MQEPWRIKLFGWLRASRGDVVVSRFPTQRVAALLAALAFAPGRPFTRDALAEMLWPEADPDAARNRFRVTLSALRHILEPPDATPGSILMADRGTVQLNAAAVVTDVSEFEEALARAESASPAERAYLLSAAVGLYGAALLPGFDEGWVLTERERLGIACVEALRQLAQVREEAGDTPGAIEALRRAVSLDPLCELAHQHLMALHLAAGDPVAAYRQYRELRRTLRREIGQPPSPATRAIAASIRAALRAVPETPYRAPEPDRMDASLPTSRALPEPAQGTPSPPAFSSHLPVPLTRFFGRDDEMRLLDEMLAESDARLVTLTGPGGSGKTRLALEVATRLQARFNGAAWFVALAERDDPRQLADAIFEAMRLRHIGSLDPLAQVVAALSGRPALLVLDNLEHLAGGGARIVRELLERLPLLRCLVTSQVRLQVAGEREIPLAPLAVPNGSSAPEGIIGLPSVRLFVDRVCAVRPSFEVNDHNADAIAAICRRLEGIPLAIELAAAWAHTLALSQMLDRLSSRFDLLVARGTDETGRHRALRTTLDWSFQLLSPELQRTFARLSVFRNGWTLDAAETVCEDPDALEHIAELRERSLLIAEENGDEMHFTMLETLHEYAAEQLPEEEREALARRHAAYYLRLVEESSAAFYGPDVEDCLSRLERHHDNIWAAMDESLGPNGDPDGAARMATALSTFWEHHGHFLEGRSFCARALALETGRAERLGVLNGGGRLAVCQGDAPEGELYAAEALELARSLGDPRQEALALRNLAFAAFIRADYSRSFQDQETSLALFRSLGDTWGMAACLDDMGSVLTRTGDYERAQSLLEESLLLYQQLGHREGIGSALFGLGVLSRELGELERARGLLEQSLEAGRELNDTLMVALSVNILGAVAAASGDLDDGRTKLEESLRLFRELRDSRGLFFALYHLGMAVERHVDPARAEGYLREGLRLAYELGDPRYTLYNLDGLAVVATLRGHMECAARLFGKVESYRQEIGHPWPPYIRESREKTVALVREKLTEAVFEALHADGAAMSLELAVQCALSGPGGLSSAPAADMPPP